ncbi:uncharacterized protein H6S33_006187 [Morchella sextelata]|uniref:uncharacterized protein n=1 Tax=Morchella sextelata TaxID=1174677 RepID=UPI001D03A3A6|nr:uncharacterized protein H6S33_006187 [Morchella sextelata]KAH0614301.1 hypothetical protein H6S33_006187 [Morchella sextelata]
MNIEYISEFILFLEQSPRPARVCWMLSCSRQCLKFHPKSRSDLDEKGVIGKTHFVPSLPKRARGQLTGNCYGEPMIGIELTGLYILNFWPLPPYACLIVRCSTDKRVKRQRQGKKGDQSSPFCMHVRPVCHTLHIGRSFLSCPFKPSRPDHTPFW